MTESETIHHRHENVGDHSIHRVTAQDSERVAAVGCLENDVTLRFELHTQQFAVAEVIVNDQHSHVRILLPPRSIQYRGERPAAYAGSSHYVFFIISGVVRCAMLS